MEKNAWNSLYRYRPAIPGVCVCVRVCNKYRYIAMRSTLEEYIQRTVDKLSNERDINIYLERRSLRN